jgi:hypothetical protein
MRENSTLFLCSELPLLIYSNDDKDSSTPYRFPYITEPSPWRLVQTRLDLSLIKR